MVDRDLQIEEGSSVTFNSVTGYPEFNIDDEILSQLFQLIEEKLIEIKNEKEINQLSKRIISEIFDNILSKHP